MHPGDLVLYPLK